MNIYPAMNLPGLSEAPSDASIPAPTTPVRAVASGNFPVVISGGGSQSRPVKLADPSALSGATRVSITIFNTYISVLNLVQC